MTRNMPWLPLLCKFYGILILVSTTLCLQGCQFQPHLDAFYPYSIKNNQKLAAINVQLGIAYLQQGYTDRAKNKLLLALEVAPHWPPALNAMAYYLESTGEFSRAEGYYRQALRRAPRDGASHNNYGVYLCRKGEYTLAIDHFLKAAKDPLYLDTAKSYENAGLCALKIPHDSLAKQYFIKALRQDPRRDTSMLELANLMLKTGRFAEGNRYITTYLQTTQPDAQGLWIALQLAQQLHDKKRAIQYETTLKKQFPLEYKHFVNIKLN